MFATDDPIVAIATPPGRGGIGIVRISGPGALGISSTLLRVPTLVPRHATLTTAVTLDGESPSRDVDEVVATYFPAPHSYTGQDVVEISAHGSPVVLTCLVQAALRAGARLAQPGEFTLRAVLNGKRDLVQAEAVADLIEASTPLQARVAFDQLEGTLTRRIAEMDAHLFDVIARLEASLDFPDEGYHFVEPGDVSRQLTNIIAMVDELLADGKRGRMIREGATVVVAGRPNVGKSSIFNKLAGSDRAIVTAIAGTTRDLVTERVDIEGLPVTLVDTAGWRDTTDVVEREGVARSARARQVADVIVVVLDRTEALTAEDEELLLQTSGRVRLLVANKSDRVGVIERDDVIVASAITGEGMDMLRCAIARVLTERTSLDDTAALSNVRHIALLEQAREQLARAQGAAVAAGTPEEFLLADLQEARATLDEIVGRRTSEDVLRHIFERFCIGK